MGKGNGVDKKKTPKRKPAKRKAPTKRKTVRKAAPKKAAPKKQPKKVSKPKAHGDTVILEDLGGVKAEPKAELAPEYGLRGFHVVYQNKGPLGILRSYNVRDTLELFGKVAEEVNKYSPLEMIGLTVAIDSAKLTDFERFMHFGEKEAKLVEGSVFNFKTKDDSLLGSLVVGLYQQAVDDFVNESSMKYLRQTGTGIGTMVGGAFLGGVSRAIGVAVAQAGGLYALGSTAMTLYNMLKPDACATLLIQPTTGDATAKRARDYKNLAERLKNI